MKITVVLQFSTLILCAIVLYGVEGEKSGRCVVPKKEVTGCVVNNECSNDEECPQDDKCCSDGCSLKCRPAVQTACELQRHYMEQQVRVLDPEEAMKVFLPQCRESDGYFEEQQCNSSGICWCVNPEIGYEIPDTRIRKGEIVNCSTGLGKCLGPTCRIFCEFGFSLDDSGCQVCKCFNPCQNIKCPASSNECQLTYVDCATGKCPIPSCRKPRTLDSLCPVGSPLLSEGGRQPLLCGLESYKPQCPSDDYKCNVRNGFDYGVCCPFKGKLGKCPANASDINCDKNECKSDIDCHGDEKCCSYDTCQGSVCIQAVNNTLCMQQREIAEHRGPSSFIPECSADGQFMAKQCDRNGSMCWCVDIKGEMIEKTMKVKEEVQCEQSKVSARMMGDRGPGRRKKNPCKIGMPLRSDSGEEIFCGRGIGRQDCPATYECNIDPADSFAVCCATPRSITKTKLGECPEFIPEPRICPRERNGTCVSDSHCPDELHCCPSLLCGSLCTFPDADSLPDPSRLPSTCEYLRNLKRTTGSSPVGRSLATHAPTCQKNGLWEPVQCTSSECWCVDEFGIEIARSRGKYSDRFDCREARENDLCDGVTCRINCNYGFVKDSSGCPICQCRSPCDGITCATGQTCVERDIVCGTGNCLPVASCEPNKEVVTETCPRGYAPNIFNNTIVLTCDDNYYKCQPDFKCVGNTDMALGICCSSSINPEKDGQCPATGRSVDDMCVEECQSDTDCSGPQKCCQNGCAVHVCMNPLGAPEKQGQCPYRPSNENASCKFECSSDFDCNDDSKCCSNGCGTSCTKPKMMTACQHANEIAEHRVKNDRRNLLKTQVPTCSSGGRYETIQCNALGSQCWCVDQGGLEIPGTRAQPGQGINCEASSKCSEQSCDLTCDSGFEMDEDGCPICKCKDLCKDIVCPSKQECRVTQVHCITDPCPPIAMCLPRLSNPCELGEPLKSSGKLMECGPKKNQCPSSHACNMSPFGEYAVCCPKPKSTCEQPVEIGVCKSAMRRWYFDSESNTCKTFTYGGCGGNLNNFNSEDDCKKTCPTLTSCQTVRRKSRKLRRRMRRLKNFGNSQVSFNPRCQQNSGQWNNIQCLDSFGLCWCVDNNGVQLPGTMVRGKPTCGTRGGRTLEETKICENGESVNVCGRFHCKGLTCKANSNAVCRINPCGSCTAEFYDEFGERVNCDQQLTQCQKKRQDILNSHRWRHQSGAFDEDDQNDIDEDVIPSTLVQRFKREISTVSAKMMLSAPKCKPDGSYNPTQEQNGLSWCVNEYGDPNHSSLSIGPIVCDKTGKVVDKKDESLVCPDQKFPARICNEACLNAQCPAYPNAVCAADPCNNCMQQFVDDQGRIVDCFESDSSSKNMRTCDQPMKIGHCKLRDERWFYNKVSQRCEEFIYGGCDGNENNFLTKQACEARCPDIVLCPSTDINKNNPDFKLCSRHKACSTLKCSNTEAVCTVDPCTCEPYFVDATGQAVNCTIDSDISNYIFDGTSCENHRENLLRSQSNFAVGCDKEGQFLPIQCDMADGDEENCWCVDEAGDKIDEEEFNRGDRKCEFVPVEQVEVDLIFRHSGEVSSDESADIKTSINEVLDRLDAEVKEEIKVDSEQDSTGVAFTLVGKNKVDAAYHLRTLLKDTNYKLTVDGRILESDYSASKFNHLRAAQPGSDVTDEKETNNGTVALIAILSILAIIVIIAAVAFYILYKKRVRKFSPKNDSALVS